MSEEKTRKKKEERTEKEQAFMDAIHVWRKMPFVEAWQIVEERALAFKREKRNDPDATL